MTLDERARVIAQKVLTTEFPYKAYATGDAMAAQAERVLQEATKLVHGELEAMLTEYHIKFGEASAGNSRQDVPISKLGSGTAPPP